jgi:hypothetical protein
MPLNAPLGEMSVITISSWRPMSNFAPRLGILYICSHNILRRKGHDVKYKSLTILGQRDGEAKIFIDKPVEGRINVRTM